MPARTRRAALRQPRAASTAPVSRLRYARSRMRSWCEPSEHRHRKGRPGADAHPGMAERIAGPRIARRNRAVMAMGVVEAVICGITILMDRTLSALLLEACMNEVGKA